MDNSKSLPEAPKSSFEPKQVRSKQRARPTGWTIDMTIHTTRKMKVRSSAESVVPVKQNDFSQLTDQDK